jgi:hypothetical protein
MNVKELIRVLEDFDPGADVHLCINWPGRVAETHEKIWVGDYGGGPQINAAIDFRGVSIYVGCVLQHRVKDARRPKETPLRKIDLGQYDSAEDAAKVRDFYIVHEGLDEPLNFPEFDYDKWIPPRTTSGEYNEHIAKILREKLLKD